MSVHYTTSRAHLYLIISMNKEASPIKPSKKLYFLKSKCFQPTAPSVPKDL